MAGPAPDITPADLLDLGTGTREGAVRALRGPRTGQRRENYEPQNRLRAGKAVRGLDTLGRLSLGWDTGTLTGTLGLEARSLHHAHQGALVPLGENSPNG